MFKTDFWKPNKSNISKPFSNISIPKVRMPNIPNIKNNKMIKVFGVLISFLLVILFVVVKPAYSVISNVNTLKADVSGLRSAVIGRDLVSFEKTLAKTESDLNDLRQSRERNFSWAKNFGPSKAYYEDSDHFINAALDGIAAGREFSTLISPFADAGGLKVREDQQVKETGLAEAVSTWISLMPQVANDLDKVIVKLDSAGTELSKINANRYPKSFRGVAVRDIIASAQRNLSSLSENAPDIKTALNIIPGVLGVDTGMKRYMIIMQNNKEQRPIMLHRVIYGSLERFIGILLEHTNGILPAWLSPIQVRVINFTDRNNKYAGKITKELKENGVRVDMELSSVPLGGKIRDAELMKIPYIIVVGDKEEKSKTIALRKRGSKSIESISMDNFMKKINEEIKQRK